MGDDPEDDLPASSILPLDAKRLSASQLLHLKAKHKLPQSVVNDVVEMVETMFENVSPSSSLLEAESSFKQVPRSKKKFFKDLKRNTYKRRFTKRNSV